MSEGVYVDVVPAEGIMFMKQGDKVIMIVAYKKDDSYIAISIPVKVVLDNLEQEGYIRFNEIKTKRSDGVV